MKTTTRLRGMVVLGGAILLVALAAWDAHLALLSAASPAPATVWSFGPARDSQQTYADGTRVPHRVQAVLLNGIAVGELEIHMHKRLGPDGKVDVSFGITTVVFGPPPGGR